LQRIPEDYMLNATASPHKLIKWPAVHAKTGKSRTQAWRDVRMNRFPAPVVIGPNSVAWFEDEIDAWLSNRPRVSYAPSKPPVAPEAVATEEPRAPTETSHKSRKARARAKRTHLENRGLQVLPEERSDQT
jgi:prophage regulatory protein